MEGPLSPIYLILGKKYRGFFVLKNIYLYICIMKKEYCLLNKSGEILKKVQAESKTLAIDLFCKIKKLNVKNLLTIYKVEENGK